MAMQGSFLHQRPVPKWDGSSLQGKRVFLYAEQGLGDAIQFVRYAKILKQRGASRVVVHGPAPLAALLRTIEGVDRWAMSTHRWMSLSIRTAL